MTSAQTRYWEYVEGKRHNQAQEELSRYATDTSWKVAQLQTDTSRYVAETNAAASRYAADTNAATQRYGIDTQAETQRYVTDTQAKTQRYVSDQAAQVQLANAQLAAATSRYAADTSASASRYGSDQSSAASRYATDANFASSMYRTDTESRDRAARLDFDRQTQLVVNDLNNKKLELERLRTSADTAYTRMRTQQVAQDMANSIESLQQSAERLEMDKTNSVFRNIESVTKSLDNFSHSYVNSMTAVDRLLEVVEKGLKLGG